MSTLLIVDVQNDFCSGGALAISGAEEIVPVINQIRTRFERVILTQDWHPENHASFAANHKGKRPGDVIDLDGIAQTLWPVHCVQGSEGSQFHRDLIIQQQDLIFKKGTDPRIDSYSAFYDNAHRRSTGLAECLRRIGIRDLTLCGLATDFCVKFSALDALSEEFRVRIVPEACRAVNLSPGDGDRAIEELQREGARLVSAASLTQSSS